LQQLLRKGFCECRALDEKRSSVRRTILVAVCTTMIFAVAACGGSASKTEVLRLRSADPLTSDLYVRIKGPSGAVGYIAQRLRTAAFLEDPIGVFAPPSRLHGRRPICSFTHTITPLDAPDLQRWRGKTVRLTVYGVAGTFCRGFGSGVYQAGS
jgi:hypothetical protein